jgi:hypothetical protein
MLTMPEEEFQKLWAIATQTYPRQDPDARWTLGEKKRAVIWYIERKLCE